VGCGPYRITEAEPGKRIVFERFENYYAGSPKGKPAIKRLVQRTIPEVTTMVAELITGGLDWIYMVPTDQAEKLEKMPNLKVIKAETMRIGFLQMDATGRTGDTPMKDVRVRRAVCHAVDREAISKNLVKGQSRVVHAACYPSQFGCTEDVVKYDYDPAKAKKLLAEAGYPDGFEIDFYGYRNRPYGEAIVGYLREVGIKANMNWLKYSALRDKTKANEVAFVMNTWGSYGVNDISNITGQHFRMEYNDLARDEQVRDWLNEGDTSIDTAHREEVYTKALQRIAEQAYWLPLFTWVANYAFDKDLEFTPYPDAVPRFFLGSWK
jgi:peptide/nickel transport system substrate-binding protein